MGNADQCRSDRRYVDDEHRRVRIPVRLEHPPTSRNHALPSISHLTRPFSVGTDQMRAAHKARRKTTAGDTVELRRTPPYKDAIGRARPLDDPAEHRENMERSAVRTTNAR